MIHDAVAAAGIRRQVEGTGERRRYDRVPFPAEIVIGWHHDLPTTMRFRVIDVSDDGFRIRSSTPLLRGMTGTILRLLPQGSVMHTPVMVVWSKPLEPSEDGYDIGLRRF